MADDIGVGDVVEALRDSRWTHLHGYLILKGHRTVVDGIVRQVWCPEHDRVEAGFVLIGLPVDSAWCECGWRKIGGSREDTIRRFAEDLTAKPPARVLEPAGAK